MNLVFAMDETAVRHAIRDGNIALSPIRQIGKTDILLAHISAAHKPGDHVFVIAMNYATADCIQNGWAILTYGGREDERPYFEVVTNSEDLKYATAGRANVSVYFDEYMNLDESERKKFYDMKHIRFCGGTATFR